MRRWLMVLITMLILAAALVPLAQIHGFDSLSASASSPFPKVWDCPPEYHDCVLAVRFGPIEEKNYNEVTTKVAVEFMADAFRRRGAYTDWPTGHPKPVKGFCNGYAKGQNGGTGYLRMEFQCRSKGDVKSYVRDFERLLRKSLKPLSPPVVLETAVILSPQLQEKLKLPNAVYERSGPAPVE